MSQWLNQVIEQAKQVDDHLAPVRQQALHTLENDGWPGRRDAA